MSDINQFIESVTGHHTVPPHVYSLLLINNGNRILRTQKEYDEFKHLFDWVDATDIQKRIINLQSITEPSHRSIVAIYGEAKKIIEFPNENLDFNPPPLSD